MEIVVFFVTMFIAFLARVVNLQGQNQLYLFLACAVGIALAMLLTNFAMVLTASLLGLLAPAIWAGIEMFVRGSRLIAILAIFILALLLYTLNPVFMGKILSQLIAVGVTVALLVAVIRSFFLR